VIKYRQNVTSGVKILAIFFVLFLGAGVILFYLWEVVDKDFRPKYKLLS
jgi:hypothetical protein